MRPVERWALFAAVLASSMAFIDATALNLVLPTLQSDLGASGADLLWIGNAYAVLLAALLPAGGSLGDRWGRRKMCLAGIALFTGASAACGLAPGTRSLIAARAFQGIGGALMLPGSLAILSAAFEPDRRGRAVGTWSALSIVASAAGPVLGGMLAQAGMWRGVFFANLPMALMAAAALVLKVPEPRSDAPARPTDLPGAVLATICLAGFNYGCIEAATRGFGDGRVAAALAGSAAAGAAFLAAERRHPYPLFPLDLLRDRRFVGAAILTLLLHGGMYGMLLLFPLNLIRVQGYGPSAAGLTQLPLMAALVILSPLAGLLVDRWGPRLPLTLGSAVAGAGFLMLGWPGLTAGPAEFWATYFPGLLVMGAGMGLTLTPLSTTVLNAVSSKHAGVASGINGAISRLSSVVGVAVLGALAMLTFRGQAEAEARNLNLSESQRQALVARTATLQVLDGTHPVAVPTTESLLRRSFATAFQRVSWLVAGITGLGALLAFASMGGAARLQDREGS